MDSRKLTDRAIKKARKQCGIIQSKLEKGFVVPVLNGWSLGIGGLFDKSNIIRNYKNFEKPDGQVKIEFRIVNQGGK